MAKYSSIVFKVSIEELAKLLIVMLTLLEIEERSIFISEAFLWMRAVIKVVQVVTAVDFKVLLDLLIRV